MEEIQVGADTCYARALHVDSTGLYMGSSNGRLYVYDLMKKQLIQEFGKDEMAEIRDLHRSEQGMITMKSGATGRLMSVQRGAVNYIDTFILDSVFLDVLDISAHGIGVMMGDPVGGYFSLYCTHDYGKSWSSMKYMIPAPEGEFGYAASGSTLKMLNDTSFVFVTGGSKSVFYKVNFTKGEYVKLSYSSTQMPFEQGEGSGAFSMVQISDSNYVVVGGNYTNPGNGKKSCYVTNDLGKTWEPADKMPKGYRSCVVYDAANEVLYCSGRNGIDYSQDGGKHWKSLTKEAAFTLTLWEGKLYGTSLNGKVKIFTIKVV
ncbi:WD40/YVTN/BNR-like repeat-containing protein [Lishizhenia tianjinensis]|nr:sialidase family protein [Lishizhenia tianjinensis]